MITTVAIVIALSGQPVADGSDYGFNGKYRIAPPPTDPRKMENYNIFLNEIKIYPGRERWSKREWDVLKQRSTKTPLVPAGKKFSQNDGLDQA